MNEEYWSNSMPDGYLAPTEDTAISDFIYFAADPVTGLPYNISVWRFLDTKNEGYPYVADPDPWHTENSFLFAKTSEGFVAGSPFLKTQSGKSVINSAFVKG